MNQEKGISLIILVITIIVIIILAGAVILSLSQNNPLLSSQEASFKQSLAEYNSELSMYIAKSYAENSGNYNPSVLWANSTDSSIGGGTTIFNILTSLSSNDQSKIEIQSGKIVYVGSNSNETIWADQILTNNKWSLEFLNVEDCAEVLNYATYTQIPNHSVQAWYKRTNSNIFANYIFIVTNNSGTQGESAICLGYYASLGIAYMVNGNLTSSYVNGELLNDGKWHHLVGTYDGTTAKLYIDGVLRNSYAQNNTKTGTFNLSIGGISYSTYSNRNANGLINNVRYYNRALTSDEVLKLYSKQEIKDGLVNYWNFVEGSGNILWDRVGYKNATIKGAIWKPIT